MEAERNALAHLLSLVSRVQGSRTALLAAVAPENDRQTYLMRSRSVQFSRVMTCLLLLLENPSSHLPRSVNE